MNVTRACVTDLRRVTGPYSQASPARRPAAGWRWTGAAGGAAAAAAGAGLPLFGGLLAGPVLRLDGRRRERLRVVERLADAVAVVEVHHVAALRAEVDGAPPP